MTNIIKRIRDIIGKFDSSDLKINIFSDDSISFMIYETDVVIVVDIKKKEVFVDCECSNHHLTADMLSELSKICTMLEKNVDVIISTVKDK